MLRRIVSVLPIALTVFLVSGCSPSQAEVEQSIRDEMKSSLGVAITSLDLKKQNDGSFLGTATAQNGDVYDVTTSKPSGDKIEWKAVPGQAMVETVVRAGIQEQLSATVKTMQLTKKGPGEYTGPAELSNGAKVTVTTHMDGTQLKWEAKPETP
jgi:hypothetical protein